MRVDTTNKLVGLEQDDASALTPSCAFLPIFSVNARHAQNYDHCLRRWYKKTDIRLLLSSLYRSLQLLSFLFTYPRVFSFTSHSLVMKYHVFTGIVAALSCVPSVSAVNCFGFGKKKCSPSTEKPSEQISTQQEEPDSVVSCPQILTLTRPSSNMNHVDGTPFARIFRQSLTLGI